MPRCGEKGGGPEIDGSRKQEWQLVMHLCCVQIQSSMLKEVHGVPGMRLAVRDTHMLVPH